MATITRTPIVDDDGTGTTGTILNNGWKQELYGQIDAVVAASVGAAPEILTSATGGAIASTVEARTHFVLLTNSTPITVTGFTAPNSLPGDRLIFMTVNATADVLFAYTPPAANQFRNWVTSAATPVKASPGGTAQYMRSSTGIWLMTAHEQGGYVVPAFTASAFGSSAGAWTVDPADVISISYRLSGQALTVAFMLATTSVPSAAATLNFTNAMWGGFTIGAPTHLNALAFASEAGASVSGYTLANGGSYYLTFSKSTGANWVVSNNLTYVYGQITFPVA
jgi:hypothetical protein